MTSKPKLPPRERKKAAKHVSRRLEQSQTHDDMALPAQTTVWAGFVFSIIFNF